MGIYVILLICSLLFLVYTVVNWPNNKPDSPKRQKRREEAMAKAQTIEAYKRAKKSDQIDFTADAFMFACIAIMLAIVCIYAIFFS